MTFTAEEHERVLKAAGLDGDLCPEHSHLCDGDRCCCADLHAPNLSQDDLAAKYLLPVATPYIDPMWPQDNGWGIMYSGNDVISSDDENIVCGATFGEALFNFVLALLDAGAIPEVPE